MTDPTITVRYFAAARAAAGVDEETLAVPPEDDFAAPLLPLAQVLEAASRRHPELARVLERCSYLCDGVAVRHTDAEVSFGSTVDVLPPFAGG